MTRVKLQEKTPQWSTPTIFPSYSRGNNCKRVSRTIMSDLCGKIMSGAILRRVRRQVPHKNSKRGELMRRLHRLLEARQSILAPTDYNRTAVFFYKITNNSHSHSHSLLLGVNWTRKVAKAIYANQLVVCWMVKMAGKICGLPAWW